MKKILLLIVCVLAVLPTSAQIVINEASYRNLSQVTDAAGDNPDWVELYNAGNDSVSLWHYHLSDNPGNLLKWTFPVITIPPKQWLLVFASGKGTAGSEVNHAETAVREDDLWKWINPTENTSTTWMSADYDDSSWNVGQGGFGWGDGDDRTECSAENAAIYTRISFEISDFSKIVAAVLHVDYDDGFIAYLNGIEIARANLSTIAWNSSADENHEALMYQGGRPDAFVLDINKLSNLVHNGKNILAIECHNLTTSLTDMSLRAFLTFGLSDAGTQFGPLPDWFDLGTVNEFHTNFKISNSGETIFLTDDKGTLIDQLVLPPQLPVNTSIGSETDGSPTRAVFLSGTPNASNETQIAYTEGFEPAPVVSFPGGFYPDSIDLTFNSLSPTAEIRFTTNGQIPEISAELYTGGPIRLRNNTVLKARCFSTGNKLPGPVATNTYFIGHQATPAGILSITMQNQDLYGETGIYDNWWTDWKRQCYIEFFEPNTHQPIFKQHAAIRVDGGAGGSRWKPQHSFRIEPGNSTLGDGDVNFPLIPARPDRKVYATFYIRNGSDQYLYYPCKDAIETRCMGDSTRNTYAGYAPVQVWLNGTYWGYYELREKIDSDYFMQHMGTNEDSLEILSVSYWYGGTLRAVTGIDPVSRFLEDYGRFLNLNPADESFWDAADHLYDLEYYTDYICAQSFIADTDWPFNNIRIHRSPETGKRWRFSLVDLEWALKPNGAPESNSDLDHIRFMLDYDQNNPYIHVWQVAMQNNRFHDYFINRFADLMNTSWQNKRLSGIADEIYSITRPELPATFLRWGEDGKSVTEYMTGFDEAHQILLGELSNRAGKVRNHVITNFNLPGTVTVTVNVEPVGAGTIRISTIKPGVYPWTGIYFDGVPVKIEAIPGPGYAFAHWDANDLISDVSWSVFLDTLTRSSVFKAHFTAETFSDQVIISEINYNSEISVDAGDWIEIWNHHKTLSASLNGWYFTDDNPTHVYLFPENTVLRPGERLVVVGDPGKFMVQHPGISYTGSFSFGLGGTGDAVKLYNFKKELVSDVVYDDASPWPLGADGQGRTLELRNEFQPVGDPSNWFDGCIGGSPGQAYSPCNEPVVFSEINYLSGSGLDHGDWVELRNTGESTEDLSGWVFKDGVDSTGHAFFIPNGTLLAPHEAIVLVQDTTKFLSINPEVKNFSGPFVFGLKDTGEWIRAYNFSGKLRLSVRYNDTRPWPVLAGGLGYTLELVDSAGVMNDGTNWMTGCIGGSPGKYYSSDCPGSGVADLSQVTDIKVFPNPATDQVIIISNGLKPTRITVKNLSGETVLSSYEPAGLKEFSVRHLPAGSYLLIFQMQDGAQQLMQVVKQ